MSPVDDPMTFELDGPEAVQRRLAAAAAARRETRRVQERVDRTVVELEALHEAVEAARSRVSGEVEDVRRLHQFSFTRVLSDLHGSREERVAREVAELEAARYALAEALDRQEATARDLAALQDRLVNLGDVERESVEAVAAAETWVATSGGPGAERLAALADDAGEVADERRECEEAATWCQVARQDLVAVADHLGAAEDWAVFDHWFGGGPFAGADKQERLDRVAELVRTAETSMRRLQRELADVGERLAAPDEEDRWARVFAVFLGDLGGDRSVRDRVGDAVEFVGLAHARVDQVEAALGARTAALDAREAAIEHARHQLLTAPPAAG